MFICIVSLDNNTKKTFEFVLLPLKNVKILYNIEYYLIESHLILLMCYFIVMSFDFMLVFVMIFIN